MPKIRRIAASLDMYRKVPTDLLEGTKRGNIMSYVCLFLIFTLFALETKAFFETSLEQDLALDSNDEPKVRVNFNITMMDLKCDHAVVDVVSALGTDQNVTQHVVKYSLDAAGVQKRYSGRNKQQNDILLKDEGVYETLEELHDNGEDAVSLDETTLKYALHEFQFVFVDFFASWCSHCRDLAPTWEVLAEVMNVAAENKVEEDLGAHLHDYSEDEYDAALKVAKPVFIAKVDCVSHGALCREQGIRGYPTLRLFVDGKFKTDYKGHRTVIELTNWLHTVEDEYKKERQMSHEGHPDPNRAGMTDAHEVARDAMNVSESRAEMNLFPERPQGVLEPDSPEEKEWRDKMRIHQHRQKSAWNEEEHPGCQISGFLMVDRTPGNFHIQARSAHHDLAAHMTNVSHEVHHLSFGEPHVRVAIDRGQTTTPDGFEATIHPIDGNVYVTHKEHEAFHHYLKVVTTNFDNPGMSRRIENVEFYPSTLYSRRAYQMLHSSQLSLFNNDVVPSAKFSYDLSPISVTYRKEGRKWYSYLTSIMAIIGGTFTVFGMVESGVHAVSSKKLR